MRSAGGAEGARDYRSRSVPVPGFVQGGHPLRHIADTNQRLGIIPGTNHRPHDGDQQNHNGDKGGLLYKWCLFYR